jgi:hypothetical protein
MSAGAIALIFVAAILLTPSAGVWPWLVLIALFVGNSWFEGTLKHIENGPRPLRRRR